MSYEQITKDIYAPLVVHNRWREVVNTHGVGSVHMNSTSVISKTDIYVQHSRVKSVFIRRFATHYDANEIQRLYNVARETLGDSRAVHIRVSFRTLVDC